MRNEADGATAAFDGFLDDAEAHAAAFDLVARLEGLEELKDTLVVLGGNAGTVVGDGELDEGAVFASRQP